MALQTLARPIFWPNITDKTGGARTLSSASTLDAAGEYVATVFRATENMTISHVIFRVNAASGSPTVDVRIETVSTTDGLPTGTLWATNTNVVSAALSAGTVYTEALTASASINTGDYVAVVFKYNSGTSVALTLAGGGHDLTSMGMPYQVNNTGTPTKANHGAARAMAVGNGATSFYYVPGMLPVSATVQQNFSTTNGDAFGNRFQVPFKCRCKGLVYIVAGTSGEFSYGLYDDSGTELSSSSTTFDIDQAAWNTANPMLMFFDNPVTLSPATWYRLALWPSSTTNTSAYKQTVMTDASEAMPYTNFHYTTKATGGAWTDTATTEALMLDLIIDQLDDGVSAGGGIKLAGRGGLAG
jgi:hypothetical protein